MPHKTLDAALKAGYSMARPGTPAIIIDMATGKELVSISTTGKKIDLRSKT